MAVDPDHDSDVPGWAAASFAIYRHRDEVTPLPYQLATATAATRKRAAAALRALRKAGLPPSAVRGLLHRLAIERMRDAEAEAWPPGGQDRIALQDLLEQAVALRGALEGLSPKARMALNGGAHDQFDDAELPQRQLGELSRLASACSGAMKYTPSQGRRRSHANIVAAVDVFTRPLGIQPSETRSSPFHRACAAAFTLAHIKQGADDGEHWTAPTASIRAYLGSAARRRDGMWHLLP